MPGHTHELRFFTDHIEGRTGQAVSLTPAIRVLFVEEGAAEMNGQSLSAGEGALVQDTAELRIGAEDVRLARWELVPQGAPFFNPMT